MDRPSPERHRGVSGKRVIRFALRIGVLVAGIVFSSCDDTALSPMEEQHPGLKALAALVVSDVSVSAATIARSAEADIAAFRS